MQTRGLVHGCNEETARDCSPGDVQRSRNLLPRPCPAFLPLTKPATSPSSILLMFPCAASRAAASSPPTSTSRHMPIHRPSKPRSALRLPRTFRQWPCRPHVIVQRQRQAALFRLDCCICETTPSVTRHSFSLAATHVLLTA